MHGALLRFQSTIHLLDRTCPRTRYVMMHALEEPGGVELFKAFELLGGGPRNAMFWESDDEVNV
jgi:hypothetical protein